MEDKRIILTGDRPSGKLHLGHYAGTLSTRLRLQEEQYNEFFIMIADVQFLTDNYLNTKLLKNNIKNVLSDYLSVGLDPKRVTIFLQSSIKPLFELYAYFLNYVSVSRLKRNPTVKEELKSKEELKKRLTAGFLCYPVSQAADILLFNTTDVPVGKDQLPMIEQSREIVKLLNNNFGISLNFPKAILPKSSEEAFLPGLDGKKKMSKSLNNCIYLDEKTKQIESKIMKAYTDPLHVNINDPGNLSSNVVFTYLDIFCKKKHVKKYWPEYSDLNDIKKHYTKGGLGDVKTKKFLIKVLEDFLSPIRDKKNKLLKDENLLNQILIDGNNKANKIANNNITYFRKSINIMEF